MRPPSSGFGSVATRRMQSSLNAVLAKKMWEQTHAGRTGRPACACRHRNHTTFDALCHVYWRKITQLQLRKVLATDLVQYLNILFRVSNV